MSPQLHQIHQRQRLMLRHVNDNKLQAGVRHDEPLPRHAIEARSGSLEPGRLSRPDQPICVIQPAGRTRSPLTRCTRQTSDRCQKDVRQHHRLMPPGRGIITIQQLIWWPFSRKTQVSWNQNVSILDFIGAKDDGRLEVVVTTGATRCAKLQSNPHHQKPTLSFIKDGCPSCGPTNNVRAHTHTLHFNGHFSSRTCVSRLPS